MVTVPGHRRSTVALATHGSESRRRTAAPVSIQASCRPRWTPATASTWVAVSWRAPEITTRCTAVSGDSRTAADRPTTPATEADATTRRRRRRPSARRAAIHRSRMRGSTRGGDGRRGGAPGAGGTGGLTHSPVVVLLIPQPPLNVETGPEPRRGRQGPGGGRSPRCVPRGG